MPKRKLVAIVDDDESIRETTKDLLESAGLAAATFASAALLLKSRRLNSISCLVADMRMPQMTGLELHRHLVASNHAIPTILITANPDDRVRAQASKSKVVCYLAKPFCCGRVTGLHSLRYTESAWHRLSRAQLFTPSARKRRRPIRTAIPFTPPAREIVHACTCVLRTCDGIIHAPVL